MANCLPPTDVGGRHQPFRKEGFSEVDRPHPFVADADAAYEKIGKTLSAAERELTELAGFREP